MCGQIQIGAASYVRGVAYFFCEVSHVAIGGLGDGGEEYKQTFVESKFNVIDGQST